MTLEVLFAQAAQGRTFLLLTLFGAALALGVHLAEFLHRRNRLLGMGADLLLAAGAILAMGQILLKSGSGLRLYGLLGLCIGAGLYAGGIAPAVGWMGRWLMRNADGEAVPHKFSSPPKQETPPPMQNLYDYNISVGEREHHGPCGS